MRIVGIETEYGTSSAWLLKGNEERHYGNIEDFFNGRAGYSAQFLQNGGRFYKDNVGDHPEYATPECLSPRDAVIYDKAGELIVQESLPGITFYKNNVDSFNATYGCHENYSVHPELFLDAKALLGAVPFLVTRQLFSGSGKIRNGRYQIYQRAEHIEKIIGYKTTGERAVINTRDEPLASWYKRLHIILGDSNMSEIATYLKTGTMSLVLDLLEDRKVPKIGLEDPIQAIREISGDETYKWIVRSSRGKISAVDVQRIYLAACQIYRGRDSITDDILNKWEYVLDCLETDINKLGACIDWVIKKNMLESFIDEFCLGWDNDAVHNMELEYHNISRRDGLFYYLQQEGFVQRLISDSEIQNAVLNPPKNTRAWFRGKASRKNLNSQDRFFTTILWDSVSYHNNGKKGILSMGNPFKTYRKEWQELFS